MATKTTNLQLHKVNPATDGADTFNFDTILNANWDKLDAHAVTCADTSLSNLDTRGCWRARSKRLSRAAR